MVAEAFSSSVRSYVQRFAAGVFLALAAVASAQAQSSIEMTAGGGVPDGANGSTLTTQTITMTNNSDNPSGTTFTTVTPGPVPTVTMTLSNQLYSLPTSVASSGTAVSFGSVGAPGPSIFYGPLSGIGTPSNSNFTSVSSVSNGTGINTTVNYGARLLTSASALQNAGQPQIGRIQMADLIIDFSSPVNDPMLHLSGLGGSTGSKGYSAEFDVLTGSSIGVTGVARVSGNTAFVQSGLSFNNGNANPGASCATNAGACGTVRVTGDAVTRVVLRIYLRSSVAGDWSPAGSNTAGDAFYVGVSAELADMSPAFSSMPTTVVPGTAYTGLRLTCTNNGPNTAHDVSCLPAASLGTVSNVVCTPAVPASVLPAGTVVCTFNYVLPVGGTNTSVVFTGRTGATNDRNGGAVQTAGNNQVQQSIGIRAPRLVAVKALDGNPGRNAATDQFTLTISGPGGPVASTTGGSGTTVTNSTATLATATAGSSYTITETAAGTTNTANYVTAYSCVNALAGGTAVSSGTGTTVSIPPLVSGDDITCTFTNTFVPRADLRTVKTLASGSAMVSDGGTVRFLITVTNNGPATATSIVLQDSLPAGLTATAGNGVVSAGSYANGVWTVPTLTVGASATLTLEGTVNNGLGGQTITNTIPAAPTADQPDPNSNGNDLVESVQVTPAPRIAVSKTGTWVDANGNGVPEVNEEIEYTFTVANTGNIQLSGITVVDPEATVSGGPITLASGATDSTTFSAVRVLTQADIDAGEFENQASVSGTDALSTTVSDFSDESGLAAGDNDPTVVTLPTAPRLALLKAGTYVDTNGNSVTDVGDRISYAFQVRNVGNVTITGISIADPLTGMTLSGGPIASLAPGASDTATFTGSYVLTQADINAGKVDNQATVSGNPPSGPAISDLSHPTDVNGNQLTSVPLTQSPDLTLVKTATLSDLNGSGRADAGDRITYAFTVSNTGNVTLTNVTVSDPLPGVSLAGGPIASLLPGAADSTTFSGQYLVTQADVDAGLMNNQATASGAPPSGPRVTDLSHPTNPNADGLTAVLLPADPSIVLDKRPTAATPAQFSATGVVLAYEFVVTNTGNVTIVDRIRINDPLVSSVNCPLVPIAPGASVTCTGGTITTTQSDIDAGGITNTAFAFTGAPGNPSLTSPQDTVLIPSVRSPALGMVKSTTENQPSDFFVGNEINYTYLVTNTGNTTLTAPITVTDNLIPAVTCPSLPGGGLAPGGTINCSGNYVITVGDVALGKITNNARATSGTLQSPTDEVTIPTGQSPDLTIAKTVTGVTGGGATYAAVGDVISYSYLVTNSGNASYAADVTVTDDRIAGDILCFDSQGGTLAFGQGATTTCSASYTVTQADLDAGSVTNEAVAKSIFAAGSSTPVPVQSSPDTATVSVAANPGLTVTKVAAPVSGQGAGQSVSYTITAQNTGNQTLSNVTVSDPLLGSLSCAPTTPATLAPAASVVCTGQYVVTQANVDAGVVANTASATGNAPTGAQISASGSVNHVTAAPAPSVALLKTGVFNDENGDGNADPGETISYSFQVTNTGNQTLTSVAVTDGNLTPSLVGTIATLAPGQVRVLTANYVIDQADIDAPGSVVANTASVTAQPPAGGTPVQGTDTFDLPLPVGPGVTLAKTSVLVDANGSGRNDAGDRIDYAFTISNTGNVTLTGLTISDTLPGIVLTGGPLASLAPGAVDSTTFTASYIVTQDDMDVVNQTVFGPLRVSNEAMVEGSYNDGTGPQTVSATDSVDTPLTQTPGIAVTKVADVSGLSSPPQAGEEISYTFVVRNTGTVTLNDITITDPLAGIVLSGGPIASLAPGAVNSTAFTATYALTTADLDAGQVENQASACGDVGLRAPTAVNPAEICDPSGTTFGDNQPTVVPLGQAPSITLVKSGLASGLSVPPVPGDAVNYQFVVTNTGNVTLRDLTFSDPLVGLIDADLSVDLAPGASDSFTLVDLTGSPYVLTQADIDAGEVRNTATVAGTPPTGPPVTDTSHPSNPNANSPTIVPLAQEPAIALIKTGTFVNLTGTANPEAGDRIAYAFTVKNTGNVTLAAIEVTDPLPNLVIQGGPIGSLAPGAEDSTTFTALYTLTQADIDAGGVTNQATATGEDPSGTPVSDTSDESGDTPADNDPTLVPLGQFPQLTLDKRRNAASPASFVAPGVTLGYDFVVRNSGNVTITDAITIDDPLVTGVTCPAGPLAPGASITCTGGVLTTTQSNVDAGGVTNTATAIAGPSGSPVAVSQPDTVVIPSVRTPGLTMVKTAPTVGSLNLGDVITYSYTVTNSGNTTITRPVTVTDNRIPSVTCGPWLAGGVPGDSFTCSGSYTVTTDDLSLGTISNNARASDGFTVSNTSTQTVPTGLQPALSIAKSVLNISSGGSTFVAAGDLITYEYVVTNTGGAGFVTDVYVIDNRISPSEGPILCRAYTGTPFSSGDSVTCQATYTVSQNDLDATFVENEAYANAIFAPTSPTPIDVQSAVDIVRVDAGFTPALTLAKSVSPAFGAAVGETLTYTIVATNSGNQTLSNVEITDATLPGLSCSSTLPATLFVGSSISCSGTRVVTQADVDAETIDNAADVTALSPQGTPIADTASVTHIPQAQNPVLDLVKTGTLVDANGNGIADIGDRISYAFTVTNSGNQTLTNVTVDDPRLSPSLIVTIASMLPGDSRTVTRQYPLVQSDLDAITGDLANTASATGDDPDGVEIGDTATVLVPLPRDPELALIKTATYVDTNGDGVQNAGDTIDYVLQVENTGNVTITGALVEDPLLGGTLTTIASLAPGQTETVTGSYVLQIADIDAGSRSNTASVAGQGSNGTALVPVIADDTADVTLTASPQIALTKTAVFNDENGNLAADVGETITYSFEITNPGNVTLTNLTVTDAMLDASPIAVPGSLAPQAAAIVVTGVHTLTAGDVLAGTLDNTAEVEGSQGATVVADTDSVTTPINRLPVAEDDLLTGLPTNANATVNPLVANGGVADSDPDGVADLDPTSVVFTSPGATGAGKTLVVPGQGTWSINPTTGLITFDPEIGFTANPTPVSYTISDLAGAVSNPATITLEFDAQLPFAGDDLISGLPAGTPANVNPLANDNDPDGTLDPTSVVFTDPGATNGGKTLIVAGEGVWTIDLTTGLITFTPDTGFTASPTPIGYNVADNDGNVSNPATITLEFVPAPPVAADDVLSGLPAGTAVTIDPLDNDNDPDGTIDPTSVIFTSPNATNGGKTLTVAGEGVWSIDPASGLVTFTPDLGFTANPTPVSYTVADNDGNISNPATITLGFVAIAPVATDDLLSGLTTGVPVNLTPLDNDSDPDGSLDPTTFAFTDPAATNGGKTLIVPGQGTWSVGPNGEVRFSPEVGFTANPTPVSYTVADNDGNISNPATITLEFIATPPVAGDDTVIDLTVGAPATVSVLTNDSDPDGSLDPTSVVIVGAPGNGQTLSVPGEGVWTVNPTTGAITFTPEAGFTADPTPIRYTVADNDGNVSNEATLTLDFLELPSISLETTIAGILDANGNGVTDPGDVITYSFTVTNTGNTVLNGVTITATSLPMPGLVCTPITLAPGQTAVLTCTGATYAVTLADAAAGQIVLNATASGTDNNTVAVSASNTAAAVAVNSGALAIEKLAGVGNARQGQVVPYTITLTNTSSIAAVVDLRDTMPAGLIYQPGSGQVGATAVEPTVSGNLIVFADVAVPANSVISVTLSALVSGSAQAGQITNSAVAVSALTGVPLTPVATATVLLIADPVFDCGTVIGRVFDDLNQDGYMQGMAGQGVISNQDYVPDSKYGAKTVKGGDERGIPGVRLVTVRGTIITTDEFGRFHVPCADLPRDIGSNFLLKLDERTLPSGFRMTTENPRVVRLTAGKMVEMNFGATISRVIRVDLSGGAFLTGDDQLQPRKELIEGLQQLVGQIADKPSVLRLTYVLGGDTERLAKARLKEVEQLIRKLWKGTGRYELVIETMVQRVAVNE